MEVATYREPSLLGRKRGFGAVGNMPYTERTQFRSELVQARSLLEKAAAALSPSSPTPAPRVVKHSRRQELFLARSEEPPAKKIKAASPPPPPVIKRKKLTHVERERLKGDLEELASELPDRIIELLKKHSRGISAGEMEIDVDSVPDEALLELRQLLDEFLRERAEHQDHGGNTMAEEDVDIVGGVSPLPIVLAPAPLQLAGDGEDYVDICGDASPVATISVSPSSSASSDSDSDSGSSSDSESDSDESVHGPSRAEQDAELLIRANMEWIARSRARAKARQEVLETERTTIPDETVHWTVLDSLKIVQYNMARPDSVLRQLGLFLKVDDDGILEQRQSFQQDLEEGEILG